MQRLILQVFASRQHEVRSDASAAAASAGMRHVTTVVAPTWHLAGPPGIFRTLPAQGRPRTIGALALCFVALNLADAVLSMELVRHGGIELNPLLAALDTWVVWKIVLATIAAVYVYIAGNKAIMRGLVGGMALIVGWNLAMAGILVAAG